MATETQVVREAPEIESYKLGLLQSAKALVDTSGQIDPSTGRPFLSPPIYQVAGLTDEQTDAINAGKTGIGAYMPYLTGAAGMLGGATQQFNQAEAQRFMNPYQQQVIDQSLQQINRQGDIARQNLQAQAVRAGAFGGSREGIQRAELERGLAEQRNQTIMGGLQQGYTQALGASEAEKNRLLQGTQAGAGIASLQQQLGQGDVNFLYNLGQSRQRQSQAELDALRSSQLQQTMQPFQNLAFLSDIYKGAPSTQMTAGTVTQPAPSPFQQFAGLATGVAAGIGAGRVAGVL
jgi:hypothetical protein